MFWRHLFLSMLVIAASSGAASAQTVMLAEAPLQDSCSQVKLTLDLKGKITFQSQGKPQTVAHNATAEHVYLERVLEAKAATAEKTARAYQTAKATIAGQTRTLRPERSLMVAHRVNDQLLTYSLTGPLLGEEMELMEHLDTLALPGLLPGRMVKVGESWTVPTAVIQAMCALEALDAQVKQELTGELKSVAGNLAVIALHGTVKGIQLGAPVAILIGADTRLHFDLQEKRIVAVQWHQTDDRKQGPATPNVAAEVTIKLTRTPIAQPAELNDIALVRVPGGPPPASLTNIEYRAPMNKYAMQHSREWQFVGETGGKRILKLVTGRGDWIADAVVLPWSGPKLDAAGFQEMIEKSPGWEQDGASRVDGSVKHPKNYELVRIAAAGKLEGAPAFRSSYLVSAGSEQVVVTIVAHPSQVNNLDARDQALVEGIELP